MYKRITHQIIEEHFDKESDAYVGCTYPVSYRPSTTDSKCENCLFFTSESFCTNWNVYVDPVYVCDYWSEII